MLFYRAFVVVREPSPVSPLLDTHKLIVINLLKETSQLDGAVVLCFFKAVTILIVRRRAKQASNKIFIPTSNHSA
jgi:hypothetical protein